MLNYKYIPQVGDIVRFKTGIAYSTVVYIAPDGMIKLNNYSDLVNADDICLIQRAVVVVKDCTYHFEPTEEELNNISIEPLLATLRKWKF